MLLLWSITSPTATGVSSWRNNRIACARPSSKTSKSARSRCATAWPARSRTVASKTTSATFTEIRNSSDARLGGVLCATAKHPDASKRTKGATVMLAFARLSGRFNPSIFRPPHCIFHLLNDVGELGARQALLHSRFGHSHRDGYRDAAQVLYMWKQSGACQAHCYQARECVGGCDQHSYANESGA